MTGFPNYLQTDSQGVSYGLGGQMSNEAALEVQALNRKRAIANLLLQRGLAGGQGGKMVGRFYVPDSPLQGLSNLFQVGVGAGLGNKFDEDQVGVAQRDQKMVADAILGHQQRMTQRADVQNAPVGVPVQPEAQAILPRPDGPYQGEVGATPMPEPGVQSAAPPIPAIRPSSIAGQEQMQGLDMAGRQPADMSHATPHPLERQPSPQEAVPSSQPTLPAPTEAPRSLRAPRRETIDDLAELMTHQHPTVRAYAAQRAAMLQRQAEADTQREVLAFEKGMDREVRREGIHQHAQTTLASLQGNLLMRQMLIDQAEKGSARHAELEKQQHADKLEYQKWRDQLEVSARQQHDETLEKIAKLNVEGRKEVAGIKADTGQGKLTDAQATAHLYATRASEADAILQELGTAYSPLGIDAKRRLGKVPLLGGALEGAANLGLSKESQRAEQAQRNFVNAVLRKESGAVINPDEFENAARQYFPQAGDSADVIEQKRQNRLTQIEGLRQASGSLKSNVPTRPPRGASSGGAVVDALPPGAKQIGFSDGKPVYQTPDGKRFIGE